MQVQPVTIPRLMTANGIKQTITGGTMFLFSNNTIIRQANNIYISKGIFKTIILFNLAVLIIQNNNIRCLAIFKYR